MAISPLGRAIHSLELIKTAPKIMKNRKFLATTALTDFWDESQEVVYLGNWCFSSTNQKTEPADSSAIISHHHGTQETYQDILETYEDTLEQLALKLNAIHGENHSKRYWRIIVGPWLYKYLATIIERRVQLLNAQATLGTFDSLCLEKECFITPRDTLEFHEATTSDSYNLQIYSRLLTSLGYSFPTKRYEVRSAPKASTQSLKQRIRRHVSVLLRVNAHISSFINKPVVIINSYLSPKLVGAYAARFWPKLAPILSESIAYDDAAIDHSKRATLKAIESKTFECLGEFIAEDIPLCFIENYNQILKKTSWLFPKRTKAIFSANCWYFDEHFKFWAAQQVECGSLAFGTQHGADYGVLEKQPSETHELTIADAYYSWGWGKAKQKTPIYPRPATKLLGKEVLSGTKGHKKILWVGTAASRYPNIESPYWPNHYADYLSWQAAFFQSLSEACKEVLVFRPYPLTYGWPESQTLKTLKTTGKIDQNKSFVGSLLSSRLYVCDHLSTTYAEALAANIPTILFFDPSYVKIRAEAKPLFDRLIHAKVLFYSPACAAEEISIAYDDIEGWWNDPDRKAAVSQFRDAFCLHNSEGVKIWAQEFADMLRRNK